VEAALAADLIVVSLDETVRGLLKGVSAQVTEVRPVTWANPDKEDEGCIAWLEGGAEVEGHRQLGYRSTAGSGLRSP